MTIYRSSGKNTEICEEYVLYTRNYVENVGGKSTFTAKGGTTFGDKPETAKPLEITNLYVKVRLNDNYNGEFGFDWVDVDPETKQIEKIQGVPFSEVEYFYKKDPANPDLGDIVATSTDPIGAKHAIQDHYNFNPISKHIDIPYVLIKCDQEITLSAEIILWQGEIKDDVITITGDEFYEFEIIGGEKEGKTAKIKVTKAGKIDFKVKCLEEGTEKKYEFKHSNPITGSNSVGGLTMMENNELKLKFRVIALVSSDGNPNEKAKTLFKKFKDAGIKDYLNKNSLNQAGYKVEIENFDAMDSADLDDYFYAFDKADWMTKKYYNLEEKERPKLDSNGYGTKKSDGTWEMEKYNAERVFKDLEIETDKKDKDNSPIMETLSIDYVVIDGYQEKLIKKAKTYSGGLIILADGECKDDGVGAFSRTTPLDHYALVVYSKNTGAKDTYSHEIGHMLGLEHTFINEKDIKEFLDSKSYYIKLKENLRSKMESTFDSFRSTSVTSKKSILLNGLQKYNLKYQAYIRTRETAIISGRASNGTFTYDSKAVTKAQYIALIQKDIDEKRGNITNNTKAIQETRLLKKDFETLKTPYYFYLLKEDSILIDREFIKNYERTWQQIISNYLYFKKKSTKNIMDYTDNSTTSDGKTVVQKIKFLNHQIKIMRNDNENNK